MSWLRGILTLLLAPLLIYQGKRVRRLTPRLPEAAGARQGQALAQPSLPHLRLLILGDSAAAGVGIEQQQQALSGALVAALRPHYQVQWQLLAKASLTTAGITAQLDQLPSQVFDLVLVSCGVNDVTRSVKPAQFAADLALMQQRLEQQYQVQRVIYTALPPMHLFPALPQPLRWFLGGKAKRLNRVLSEFIGGQPKAQLLTIKLPFERHYMASDGYHPSAHATPLWAQAVLELLQQQPLEPTDAN